MEYKFAAILNATTMHKEDCPNLDPEQIMAIDCIRILDKEIFFSSFLQDAVVYVVVGC